MSLINALVWTPTPECLYRDIKGAAQLCSEFRFKIYPPGYAGQVGFIKFDAAGRVTVSPGYVWDKASGPTIDTPDSICGSLGHDVGYELIRAGKLPVHIYKDVIDLWFFDRLREDGMPDFRAFAWYQAVRLFGEPSTRPENAPVIKRAPVPFPSNAPTFTPVPGYTVAALSA